MSAGDWEGARPLFARAAELNRNDLGFNQALFTTRCALGEYVTLEKELQAAVKAQSMDFVAKMQLVQVLLAESRPTEARKVVAATQELARRSGDPGLATATGNLVAMSRVPVR